MSANGRHLVIQCAIRRLSFVVLTLYVVGGCRYPRGGYPSTFRTGCSQELHTSAMVAAEEKVKTDLDSGYLSVCLFLSCQPSGPREGSCWPSICPRKCLLHDLSCTSSYLVPPPSPCLPQCHLFICLHSNVSSYRRCWSS